MPTPFRNLSQIYTELEKAPPEVLASFRAAVGPMERRLTRRSLTAWAGVGAAILKMGPPARDAAEEYFRSSPLMAERLPTRAFLRWARLGGALSSDMPAASATLLKVSPMVITLIPPRKYHQWAKLGLRLWSATGALEVLVHHFFEESPRLLERIPLAELVPLVDFLIKLANRSPELAWDVFDDLIRLSLVLTREEREGFLDKAVPLANRNPAATKALFEAGWTLYAGMTKQTKDDFLEVIGDLAESAPSRSLAPFLSEASRHLVSVDQEKKGVLLRLSANILRYSPPTAREFLKQAPFLSERLSIAGIEQWCQRGMALMAAHPGSGLGYFRLQSREALDQLSSLASGVELGEVREVLRLYCQALMGKTITVMASEELTDKSLGWTTSENIPWEGGAIFVPSRMGEFDAKGENFEAYKVLATHQAGHLEFLTFEFSFDREGSVCKNLRRALWEALGQDRPHAVDYERYFELFADRRLARDLFTLAEDTRVDFLLKSEYKGIRAPYKRIQNNASGKRPSLAALPLREASVEILVRISLNQSTTFSFPQAYVAQLMAAAGILRHMANPLATAEDAAEAALRLYLFLKMIPNITHDLVPPEEWVTVDLSNATYDLEGEEVEALADLFRTANRPQPSGEGEGTLKNQKEQPYHSFPSVGHRGDLRPELVQTLLRLQKERQREAKEEEAATTSEGWLTQEILNELMEHSGELFDVWGISDNPEALWPSLLMGNLIRGRGSRETSKDPLGPLAWAEEGIQTFTYDEWDYRANSYRPKWCQVRQRTLREGQGEFFNQTLHSHHGLVSALRKQFEMLRPEHLGKVKRLLDGEEFDLDAVVDSVVEKKSGRGYQDKIYWRRSKKERNVAVALLLDMSLSTDERIEQDNPTTGKAQSSKKIIELEKESLVLLIEALEQIGDVYGIYGFSSSGRDDVQFYIIKDTKEPFTEKVKRRIDRVSPLQGTRMGPAIRHTITTLAQEEAKTKILLLLSDGRPQDLDYGTLPWEIDAVPWALLRSGDSGLRYVGGPDLLDEKEYAVHDTKVALNEARAKNIIPFCISVDKQGRDYLRAMCGDIGYEVVGDVESLPRRLTSLYRRLTT